MQLEAQLANIFINHTITASAGPGGTINPTSAVSVPPGGSQNFTLTPSPGYVVQDVLADGDSVGAVTDYTFTNVQTSHTISATFLPIYANWADIKGLDGTVGKENGINDDPDKDGRTNLQEFAFNGNPCSGTDNGQLQVLTSGSKLILTIAVRNSTDAFTGSPPTLTTDGITYTIEGSTSLDSYLTPVVVMPVAVTTGLPAAGDGYQYRSFSLHGDIGSSTAGFIRAKVTQP